MENNLSMMKNTHPFLRSFFVTFLTLILLFITMITASCSKPKPEQEITGTITRYGFDLTIKQSLGGRFTLVNASLLELREYPDSIFRTSTGTVGNVENLPMYGEFDKSGSMLWYSYDDITRTGTTWKISTHNSLTNETSGEFWETPSDNVKITLWCSGSGDSYSVSSFEMQEATSITGSTAKYKTAIERYFNAYIKADIDTLLDALDDAGAWAAAKAGYADSGAKSPVPTVSGTDRKVAENIETIWTTFARTGNPGVKGLIDWPAWDSKTDKYLLITEPLQVKTKYTDLLKIKPDTSKWTIH